MIRIVPEGSCEPVDPNDRDPQDFAREVRRLAIDAYKALTYPDVADYALADLKLRSADLIRLSHAPRGSEITKWLRSIDRAIETRLQYEEKVSPGARRVVIADVGCMRTTFRALKLRFRKTIGFRVQAAALSSP
jgi:hypothetical protein